MNETQKKAVGTFAVSMVHSGMKIGIGTGSTVHYFIKALLEKNRLSPLSLQVVCTSKASENELKGTFPLLSNTLDTPPDITFDGADRIDDEFRLIKGGGGALFREKMVALVSKENVVLVDESKWSNPLSGFPVAIEIAAFGMFSTISRLQKLGYRGMLREGVTDNGNRIFDIAFDGPIHRPEEHHSAIKSVAGVLETGFFFDTVKTAIVGLKSGKVEVRKK
ncbi:MAG: ribose 5-phosphate isomerase A [Chlamydiae bacterium RIFCSPHIGHO2_12_FULL_49_11]|nr:MAG: ribose 5-phosphate isomerase A [Chlamydiae bacterium RIFCSPHIGHO2_12_FULL_49_11]